ncbi:MAG: hypothetical protein HY688_03820 [Chloroflexi bacterium]|nr:hypothetical protein [Chloroflexota bacterium]
MSSPLYPAQWLLFLALYRACYETANAGPPAAERNTVVAVTSREREWADRATRRYAQAQEKKWRRWNDAMFERSG